MTHTAILDIQISKKAFLQILRLVLVERLVHVESGYLFIIVGKKVLTSLVLFPIKTLENSALILASPFHYSTFFSNLIQ